MALPMPIPLENDPQKMDKISFKNIHSCAKTSGTCGLKIRQKHTRVVVINGNAFLFFAC